MLSWCRIIAFVSEAQGKRTLNARGLHYNHNGRFGWQSRGWGKVRMSVFHWWARVLLATWAQWTPFSAQNRLCCRRRWHTHSCPTQWALCGNLAQHGGTRFSRWLLQNKKNFVSSVSTEPCVLAFLSLKKNKICFPIFSLFQSEWTKVNFRLGSRIRNQWSTWNGWYEKKRVDEGNKLKKLLITASLSSYYHWGKGKWRPGGHLRLGPHEESWPVRAWVSNSLTNCLWLRAGPNWKSSSSTGWEPKLPDPHTLLSEILHCCGDKFKSM